MLRKTLFSLRTKLFLAFFCLSIVMVTVISYIMFTHMQTNHLDTLKRDLRVIAELEVEMVAGVTDNGGDRTSQILKQIADKEPYIKQVSLLRVASDNSEAVMIAGTEPQYASRVFEQLRAALQSTNAVSSIMEEKDKLIAFAFAPGRNGAGREVLVLDVDQTVINQDIRHFLEQVLGAAGVAFAVVGWASWLLARNFNRRIEALQAAISEIAAGKYELGLQVDGKDEVAQLANCIKDLAAKLHGESEGMLFSAIESLVTALEAKDEYTYGHSSQVSAISVAIGQEMGLAEDTLFKLHIAALLHDIGKIGVPDRVLNKQGSLTEEEWGLIEKHPVIGAKIIAGIPALEQVGKTVLHHHARWDGKGYPEALAREDIPIEARIIAVADTYQAMTSDRPYRKGLAHVVALVELRACSGLQFDPAVVEMFCRIQGNAEVVGVMKDKFFVRN